MLALNAAKIDADFRLAFEIGLLAQIMREKNVFGRDRRIGFELEAPVPVLLLMPAKGCGRRADAIFQLVACLFDFG